MIEAARLATESGEYSSIAASTMSNIIGGSIMAKTHGMSSKKHSYHNIYKRWKSIIQRCYGKKGTGYIKYAARGVTVHDDWKNNPVAFVEWCIANGYSDTLQIDRIDNSKGYSPDNCRFVTCRENCLNRRPIISSNTSGYTGVSKKKWSSGYRWVSYIEVKGKRIELAYRKTIEEALKARNNYIIESKIERDYHIQEYKGDHNVDTVD